MDGFHLSNGWPTRPPFGQPGNGARLASIRPRSGAGWKGMPVRKHSGSAAGPTSDGSVLSLEIRRHCSPACVPSNAPHAPMLPSTEPLD
jgi:hypothetical protein